MKTAFSVLMPVYHGDDPHLLKSALCSVFSNSVQPDQVVLVIDGSISVELEFVLSSFREPALEVVRLPQNSGIIEALNFGLKFCRHDLVARCDADDLNLPDRFMAQIKAFSDDPDLALCGGQVRENSDGTFLIKFVPVGHYNIGKYLRFRNPFNHMSVMFRRSVIVKLGGYPNIKFREDYALWASVFASGFKCSNLDVVLVEATTGQAMYRRRGRPSHFLYEFHLQQHLARLGVIDKFDFSRNLVVRMGGLFIGASLRELMYKSFLRRRP